MIKSPDLRRPRFWYLTGSAAALGLLPWFVLSADRLDPPSASEARAEAAQSDQPETGPQVQTVRPVKGGLTRRTSQPGSAHSYESAELFSKVSGFLKSQQVDIGSRVQRGDLLAEIDVPELIEDVQSAKAVLEQARAEVAQAEARIENAAAEHKAAQSRIAQSAAEVERCQADVGLSQKQLERIRELNALDGIEDRAVDERQFQLQGAQASLHAAQSAVVAAEQQSTAAASRVELAKAELQVSRARAGVAESQLERAQVMASYTKIVSPYDGVVTSRSFHPGAYVRAPDQGGQVALLAVDRTDRMRVRVRIPERDVPFVHPGDQAIIRFDALPQRDFEAVVSRVAESQDPATRTMLAEIDLDNADRTIRDQMYGRVEITLEESDRGVLLPSTCLVGDSSGGKAAVYVVDQGKVSLRQVQVGKDTGIEVEILSGLTPDDVVVQNPPGGLVDGTAVASSPPVPPVRPQ